MIRYRFYYSFFAKLKTEVDIPFPPSILKIEEQIKELLK